MRPRIYVAGYPRSGTTWLCRLIADAWDCPLGTMHNKGVFHGHPAEGKDRAGPFVVLHGHSPPQKIATEKGDFVLFIYRDPRDVIVSISHYFKTPLDEAINDAIHGRSGATGPRRHPIAEYVREWLYSDVPDYITQYEDLHENAGRVLHGIEQVLQVMPLNDFPSVVRRQAFARRKGAPALDPEHHKRHMRKGIVGDWQNHLTVLQLARTQENIEGLGYW